MTPTDASAPSSLYRPSSSEPIASSLDLLHPVTRDHAVGGAHVLDLEHDALVRLIGDSRRFGDHPVQASALELGEPPLGRDEIRGQRSHVERRADSANASTRVGAAFAERPTGCMSSSPRASTSNAMNDAGVFSASIRTRLSAGWMRCLQRLEVQTVRGGNADLPVDERTCPAVLRWPPRPPREVPGPAAAHCGCRVRRRPVPEADRSKPSHFGSYQAPDGIDGTDFASIGETGGMTGSSIGPSFIGSFVLGRFGVGMGEWTPVAEASSNVDGAPTGAVLGGP